jgi:predicted dehydrogenase
MDNYRKLNRRDFISRAAAAVSFPYVVRPSALGLAGTVSPSNRVNLGHIGVGARGSGLMRQFLHNRDAVVTAVCDVKSHRRQMARKWVDEHYEKTGCREYHDFRQLVADQTIDAVCIASTDHWHVLHALAAAKAGKDVCLEKPMGVSLAEDQALRETCRMHETVFQFGTQQRSDARFRQACELALNGRLGKVHTINVLSPSSAAGGTLEPAPVPEGLDYDFWLGPAPYVPYTTDRCSNKLWWFNSDYAVGWIAGWGVHPLDIALWGGGPDAAGRVKLAGRGTYPADGFCDTATQWMIRMDFESGLVLNYAGGEQPPKWRERYGKDKHGVGFEGTEGWVHVNRSRIVAEPPGLLKSVIGPDETNLYLSNSHTGNFIDCVKSREETICPVDAAVKADIMCHISDIALRTGQKLAWDTATERFVNNADADRYLERAMRKPWRL